MTFARAIAESEFRDASSRSARNGTQASAGNGKGARLAEATRQARRTQHAMIGTLRSMARAESARPKARDDQGKRYARAMRETVKRAEYALAYLTSAPNEWAESEARAFAREFARASFRKRAHIAQAYLERASAQGGIECARALVAHVTILARRGLVSAPNEPDHGFTLGALRPLESAFASLHGEAYATARKLACGTARALSNAHDAVSFDGPQWSRADLNRRAIIVGDSGEVVSSARAALRAAFMRAKFKRAQSKKTGTVSTQGNRIENARKRVDPKPAMIVDDNGRAIFDSRSAWHRRARLHR